MASPDMFYYYGSHSANTKDRLAAHKVMRSAHSGERVYLKPHEAAYIRSGAEWFAAHKSEFSVGYRKAVADMYKYAYDQDGHKVVDARKLR